MGIWLVVCFFLVNDFFGFLGCAWMREVMGRKALLALGKRGPGRVRAELSRLDTLRREVLFCFSTFVSFRVEIVNLLWGLVRGLLGVVVLML